MRSNLFYASSVYQILLSSMKFEPNWWTLVRLLRDRGPNATARYVFSERQSEADAKFIYKKVSNSASISMVTVAIKFATCCG